MIEVTHLANIRVRPRISPRHIDHAHRIDIVRATIQQMLFITFSTSSYPGTLTNNDLFSIITFTNFYSFI